MAATTWNKKYNKENLTNRVNENASSSAIAVYRIDVKNT